MHGTRSIGRIELPKTEASRFEATTKSSAIGFTVETSVVKAIAEIDSLLAIVMDAKIAKTDNSILAVYLDIYLHNNPYFYSRSI